jgi:hypothetical protein
MPVWGDTFASETDDPASGEIIARNRIAAITGFIQKLQN